MNQAIEITGNFNVSPLNLYSNFDIYYRSMTTVKLHFIHMRKADLWHWLKWFKSVHWNMQEKKISWIKIHVPVKVD